MCPVSVPCLCFFMICVRISPHASLIQVNGCHFDRMFSLGSCCPDPTSESFCCVLASCYWCGEGGVRVVRREGEGGGKVVPQSATQTRLSTYTTKHLHSAEDTYNHFSHIPTHQLGGYVSKQNRDYSLWIFCGFHSWMQKARTSFQS